MNNMERELFIDSIADMIKKSMAVEDVGVSLLYLWIATARDITLREACEQYGIKKDTYFAGHPLQPTFNTDMALFERTEPKALDFNDFADFQIKTAKILQDILEKTKK